MERERERKRKRGEGGDERTVPLRVELLSLADVK